MPAADAATLISRRFNVPGVSGAIDDVTFGCAFYEIPAPSSTNDVGIDAQWVPVSTAGFGWTGNFTGNSASPLTYRGYACRSSSGRLLAVWRTGDFGRCRK